MASEQVDRRLTGFTRMGRWIVRHDRIGSLLFGMMWPLPLLAGALHGVAEGHRTYKTAWANIEATRRALQEDES